MLAAWYAPEVIVAPMRLALEWFLGISGNYGAAIILLTITLRVLILPLTIYQMKSMKKMQEVQPRLKELQAKYKEDPQRLNQEMMNLYKTEGYNPLSGCLPLLIQMPFLYAIFAVLQTFDPMQVGAGYSASFLWVPDLNLADPKYVLPILTVLSMILQSFFSMVGNDPNQKIMMYMLPLVFGYISFNMQAGVLIYWVVSTTVGLIQQAIYPGFPRFKPKGEADVR